MMKSRCRWRRRRVCDDHGEAALRRGMPKTEGGFPIPLKGLFALAFWPQEFAIAAAHQGEAALYKADGATPQIMGFPRVLRDSLLAKKGFSDLAIGFALAVSVERAQGQGETLAPLRR